MLFSPANVSRIAVWLRRNGHFGHESWKILRAEAFAEDFASLGMQIGSAALRAHCFAGGARLADAIDALRLFEEHN